MLSGIADILFALAGFLFMYILWNLKERVERLEQAGILVYKPTECNNAVSQTAKPTPKA